MEKFSGFNIIKSSLSHKDEEFMKKNVLSWIITFKNGDVCINPDYKIILCNSECCALKNIKKLKGWENVYDLSYIAVNYTNSVDKSDNAIKGYLSKITNVDLDFYNSMYFHIEITPFKNLYFGIIGKKYNLETIFITRDEYEKDNEYCIKRF